MLSRYFFLNMYNVYVQCKYIHLLFHKKKIKLPNINSAFYLKKKNITRIWKECINYSIYRNSKYSKYLYI